jgi:hypothetical protein
MVEKLSLEWSYTPANFFEEPFEYSENGWVVEIGDGRIVATFSGVTGEQVESACREKHEEVSARFLGAQLLNHQPYQLSDYKTTRARPDGSVEVGISFGATLCISDGRCDVMIRDAAGNVTTDTKKERVERRKEFARRDPRNELTYLYEIRDALAKEFGGAGGVCSALGITKNQWGEMGRLANKVPLAQGRHRGQSVGQLRDAMPAELDEGRRIAKLMVERYFDYLDKLASAGPTHAA